jgi:hypothetical protein
MPRFTITETVTEKHEVDADSAQEALDIWLIHGSDSDQVSDEYSASVESRVVTDENGVEQEVEDH